MNWYNELISRLDKYFSDNENKIINKQNIELEQKDCLIDDLNDRIQELQENASVSSYELEELQQSNDEFVKHLKDNNKHYSLLTFKRWMNENIVSTQIKYRFRDSYVPVHLSLHNVDDKFFLTFIKNDLHMIVERFVTLESFIYSFVLGFHKRFPVSKYYAYDEDAYGKSEWWENPDIVLQRFLDGKKDDCDGFTLVMYSCLKAVIMKYYPTEMWRLRCFIVAPITGGGHILLGWVKSGCNDWVPIESTWYTSSFKRAWLENITIRKNSAYDINYSFNHITEYRKI